MFNLENKQVFQVSEPNSGFIQMIQTFKDAKMLIYMIKFTSFSEIQLFNDANDR